MTKYRFCYVAIPTKLTEDQKACLQSFSFPDMDFRKNDVEDPIDKTCAWILNHRIYLRWLDEHRGLLWLKGKPGAGKSTLLRYALRQQKDQDMLIVASFFFHGRGAPIQKSLLGFFRSLLFQILQHIPSLLSSCSAMFKRKRDTQGTVDKDWKWQASELQNLFILYITNAMETHSVEIFVDALDECGEETATYLVDFLQRLIDELPQTKASLRICFSCRHYPLVALENGLDICVEDENQDDIQIYVRHKLEAGIRDKIMLEKLQENILQRSLNVFQWVVLVVPGVILLYKKGKSFLSIQKVLEKIPTKLNELYQELLHGIDDNEKPQSLQLMQWICFALRPLSLRELRFALAVDAQTPHDSLAKCQAAEEFAYTDEEMEKRINDLSKGLAEVKKQDQEQVAQFIHQSVSDYLIQDGLNVLTNNTVTDDVVGWAHFRLSRSCILYATMKEIVGSSSILPVTWRERIGTLGTTSKRRNAWMSVEAEFPFLRYSVTSWVAYAKEMEKRHISQRDLFDFFSQSSGDNLQALIRVHSGLNNFRGRYLVPGQTLLHIASIFGFYDVVSAILDTDESVLNSKTPFGISRTSNALLMVVHNGNEAVVKLLLAQRGIAPTLADCYGETPLHKGARFGRAGIVKMLLARKDIAPNLRDNDHRTPLYLAATCGHLETVRLLLARNDIEIEPRSRRLGYRAPESPIAGAKRKDYEEFCKFLGHQVPEGPIEAAKQYRHEEIAKILEARLHQQQQQRSIDLGNWLSTQLYSLAVPFRASHKDGEKEDEKD